MSNIGEDLRQEMDRFQNTPSYYPSDVWFSGQAEKLVSDFLWAQKTSETTSRLVAISSVLIMIKFMRENNFISLQTKDFYLTHNKLNTYWDGVEKVLNDQRKLLLERAR